MPLILAKLVVCDLPSLRQKSDTRLISSNGVTNVRVKASVLRGSEQDFGWRWHKLDTSDPD